MGGFQHNFSHPSLPTSQSFGITGDETPDNGLTGTLVRFECHQTITKSNIITLTKYISKKNPHIYASSNLVFLSCKTIQVLVYIGFS